MCSSDLAADHVLTAIEERAEDGRITAETMADWHRECREKRRSVAEDIDASPAQVALRWLIDQREFTCVPIFGARTVDQVEENVGAVDVSLSADQYDRIDEAY